MLCEFHLQELMEGVCEKLGVAHIMYKLDHLLVVQHFTHIIQSESFLDANELAEAQRHLALFNEVVHHLHL